MLKRPGRAVKLPALTGHNEDSVHTLYLGAELTPP